jgi:eukaryotic-like serine/threonine-protein kinase
MRNRFLREGYVANSVDHPGAVAVLDDDVAEDGSAFLVMELLHGGALDEVAMRYPGRKVPLALAAGIGDALLEVLAAAHAKGIVHRDLKPANVFLTNDARLAVLDFGIARLRDDATGLAHATQTGVMLGTPAFMAPEQALAESGKIDAQSDVWAVGATLFTLLTAHFVHEGDNPSQLMVRAATTRARPVASLANDVPAPVAAVIDKALAFVKDDRWRSAVAMREALAKAYVEATGAPIPPLPKTDLGPTTGDRPASGDVSSDAERMAFDATVDAGSTPALPTPSPLASTSPSPAVRPSRSGASRRTLAAGVSAIVVVVVVVAASALLVRSRVRTSAPEAPPPSPLLAAGSMLACPQLEASGVDAPSGWLGAAASAIACERARVLFAGGRTERTLVPAELLDLPREPSEQFPFDPYGAEGARARALAAAHARAAAYLDGHIEFRSRSFAVELVLRDRQDRELARGSGEAPSVFGAVQRAMGPLVSDKGLPPARALDPETAAWEGPTLDAALAAQEFALATAYTPDLGAECESIIARVAVPELAALDGYVCAFIRGREPPAAERPAIDDSSPARLEETARAALALDPKIDAHAVAARVEAALQRETTARGRARLAATASCLRQAAGDTDGALQLALRGLQASIRPPLGSDCTNLDQITWLSESSASALGAARAQAAWAPFAAMPPRRVATNGSPEWLVAARRGNVLAPYHVTIAADLAVALLREGRRQEARSVAAVLTDGPLNDLAAALILARVDASEAQFGAGLDRLRRTLAAAGTATGFAAVECFELWRFARDLAVLLGREREVADEFVDAFVGHGRPEVLEVDDTALASASSVCMYASRSGAARCFAKLHDLVKAAAQNVPPGADAILSGAEAFSAGNLAGAARAWRPLTLGLGADTADLGDSVPLSLAAAGDHDLAAQLDARALDGHGPFNGVSMAYVRAATAAAQRGDKARASELASQVVAAWQVADVEPVALPAMRRLR